MSDFVGMKIWRWERTYTGKSDVAVTALGDSAALLNVQVSQVSTRRLDDLSASRLGVVGVALAEGDTLSHLVVGLKFAQDRQQE